MKKMTMLVCALALAIAPCALAESTPEPMTVSHEGTVGTAQIAVDPLEEVFAINADTLKTYAWVNDAQVTPIIPSRIITIFLWVKRAFWSFGRTAVRGTG